MRASTSSYFDGTECAIYDLPLIRPRLRFFFTAAFAPRIARPSSPVRSRIEFATRENCRFFFGVFAFFVKRFESLLDHGIKTKRPASLFDSQAKSSSVQIPTGNESSGPYF